VAQVVQRSDNLALAFGSTAPSSKGARGLEELKLGLELFDRLAGDFAR
jgi:hypothetical protein